MKSILIVGLSMFLLSCTNSKTAQETIDVKPASFLDAKLRKFVRDHPEWSQNDVLKEEVNSEFKDSIDVWKKSSSFLKGIPMKLSSVDIKEMDRKPVYVAYFKVNDVTKSGLYDGLPIELNVLVQLSRDNIKSLTQDEFYFIEDARFSKNIDVYQPEKREDYYDIGSYIFKASTFKKTF